jgi:hypothetical protein
MMASYKRWIPVRGIKWPCASVTFSSDAKVLAVRLDFRSVHDGGTRDLELRVAWRSVIGFTTFEELFESSRALESPPLSRLRGEWSRWVYPLFEITGSDLIGAHIDRGGDESSVRHFMIVSMDHTVELLVTQEPDPAWIAESDDGVAPARRTPSIIRFDPFDRH